MTDALKQTQKVIKDSLGFLDIMWVRVLLIILAILYIVGGVPMMTSEVARIFHNPLVKMGFVLLILYVGVKDIPLALLLALAFVLSLQMGYRYYLGGRAGIGAGGAGISAEAGYGDEEGGDGEVSAEAKIGSGVEGMTGDDSEEKLKGYNYSSYSDCVKDCAENDLGSGDLNSPCSGVGVWKDELNAQGLNCPLGYSGDKDGAPF